MLQQENNRDPNTEQKNQNRFMSRKKQAPKRIFYPDSKYGSLILAKFINFVMYDGKKAVAEKIVYNALNQIKNKTKEDPIKIFNDAVNNIRPNLEVRSRRVGGATYQVPQEVKTKRSQTLALRWLLDASRKRKNKSMSDKLFNELMDASQNRGAAIKKREDTHRMAESNKAFAHYRW